MRTAIAGRVRTLGLSVPQLDVLTTLSEREGVSQQELAQRLYVTKGNISGLVDRLELAGLVERRAIEGDRRSHAIHLTPSGRATAHEGVAMQRAFVAQTLGRLSQADVLEFDRLLVAFRDKVREQTLADERAPEPIKLATE